MTALQAWGRATALDRPPWVAHHQQPRSTQWCDRLHRRWRARSRKGIGGM